MPQECPEALASTWPLLAHRGATAVAPSLVHPTWWAAGALLSGAEGANLVVSTPPQCLHAAAKAPNFFFL